MRLLLRGWLVMGGSFLLCVSCWAASFNPDADCTLITSLTVYWNLDEASGTRADPIVGANLTDNNTVTQGTLVVGNSAQFTSANSEELTRADSADISLGNIDASFAGWVSFDTINEDAGVIAKWGAAGAREYLVSPSATRLRWLVTSDGTATTIVTANTFGNLSTATAYFYVAIHDSVNDVIKLSINNGAFDQTATAAGVVDGTTSFSLGNQGGVFFNGEQDEVGLWKKVLSAGEISDLYNGGSGNTYNAAATCAAATRGVIFISQEGPQIPCLPNGQGGFHPPGSGPGSIGRALAACRGKS